MKDKNEIQEIKSLRWLANMFPFTKNPEDISDKVSNVINEYCTVGANKIEELTEMVNVLTKENNELKSNIRKYEVVTLCGSTKFKDKFMEVQKELTLKGKIVLNLGVFNQSDNEKLSKETIEMLANMHKQKIDIADEIFVINVGGYIGESTKAEIEYAKSMHKNISYLENKND